MNANRPTTDALAMPRWIHWLAIATVCAVLPLVVLGAEVTTKQVGMADPQSIREPWYLFTLPWHELLERGIGYVIEHSHRLAGWLVGGLSIVLAWAMASHIPWRKGGWLGFLAVGMVGIQGILGIFRVKFHALAGPNLAMIHGLFAQLVVATLVAVAVVTSRAWWQQPDQGDLLALRGLAMALAGIIYLQIFIGAVVRHFQYGVAQRLHALVAFAVVAVAVWLARSIWMVAPADRALRRATWLVLGFLAVQVALGIEAWIGRFGAGMPVETLPVKPGLDIVRSSHYLVGTLLFSAAVGINLFLHRPTPATLGQETSTSMQAFSVGGVA